MAHRVRPRRQAIDQRMEELGLPTGVGAESAQARKLDVAPSIHHRALKGVREMNAFYALRLLWELGTDETRRDIDTYFDLARREPTCEPVAS